MFRKILLSGFTVVLLSFGQMANASTIDLFDCAIKIDDTINGCDPFGDLDENGLGTLTFSITGAGSHSFDAFFDYEIDESRNTYFNEYGSTGGAPAAGQTWEIDEPEYVFGDIYTNFDLSALDNSNAVPIGFEDDVSFTLGWDFALGAGETATVRLFLSDFLDTSGFYLKHTDDEVWIDEVLMSESVYFWSTLDINGGGGTPVPEPGTLWLIGAGLIALGLSRRKS